MTRNEKLLARHTGLLKEAFFALKKANQLRRQADTLETNAYQNLLMAGAIEKQLKKGTTP